MKQISKKTASAILSVLGITIILLAIIQINATFMDVKELKEIIKKKQLAVDCKFLDPNSAHSAIIYDRFKGEIRVECQQKIAK